MEDTIKALLPKEKETDVTDWQTKDESQKADVLSNEGYNQAIREVHALVPAIIEAVYGELRGKIELLPNIEVETVKGNISTKVELNAKSTKDVLSLLSTKKP